MYTLTNTWSHNQKPFPDASLWTATNKEGFGVAQTPPPLVLLLLPWPQG